MNEDSLELWEQGVLEIEDPHRLYRGHVNGLAVRLYVAACPQFQIVPAHK
jgi:hypothetical protein